VWLPSDKYNFFFLLTSLLRCRCSPSFSSPNHSFSAFFLCLFQQAMRPFTKKILHINTQFALLLLDWGHFPHLEVVTNINSRLNPLPALMLGHKEQNYEWKYEQPGKTTTKQKHQTNNNAGQPHCTTTMIEFLVFNYHRKQKCGSVIISDVEKLLMPPKVTRSCMHFACTYLFCHHG